VPALVALLAKMRAAGIATDIVDELLQPSIDWLLAQRLTDSYGWFTSWNAKGAPADSHPARAAWCYGDPGVAVALAIAARDTNNAQLDQTARAIAVNIASRSVERCGVRDAGLCHGGAGLAHILNRCYQRWGDDVVGDAARAWFERTLDMQADNTGYGGFLSYQPREGKEAEWVAEGGMLNGSAGVGLALLAAISPIEPAWDRMLMIS
jgi:lantibiotic modifying enzyme